MLVIGLFAVLLAGFSAIMITSPRKFSEGIVSFSQQRWFHPFEIVSRILFGIAFVYFAEVTRYPALFEIIGYVLLLVGLGLALTPKHRHIKFAELSATYGAPYFRVAGCLALPFSFFIVYSLIP